MVMGEALVSVVCSVISVLQVIHLNGIVFCPLWALAGSHCMSPHATFAVPVVVFYSVMILAAFLRSCRVGHLSSTSITLNLILLYLIMDVFLCCLLV